MCAPKELLLPLKQRWHEGSILAGSLPSLGSHCEACPVELATCKVMLHMRFDCAGDVFVHVCSHNIAYVIEALRLIEASRLKQNIIHACVSVCLLKLKRMEK